VEAVRRVAAINLTALYSHGVRLSTVLHVLLPLATIQLSCQN
jgi:hypothetical protein